MMSNIDKTRKYLTIDVGGTSIKYGVVSLNSNDEISLDKLGSMPTPRDTMENLLECYREIYEKIGKDTLGVGISFTATLDVKDGYCFDGGLRSYTKGIKLLPLFQSMFPVPVALENDGNCGALAEGRYGSLKDVDYAVAINLGSGVGGGILYKGEILRGKNSTSGEFSYIYTDYATEKFSKTWASHNGRIALGTRLAKIKNRDDMSGKEFFEYANKGDEDAVKILKEFCDFFVAMIFNLQCVYAPERISISGGISRQPILMEYLEKSHEEFYNLNGVSLPKSEIVLSKFQNEGNLIGAFCHLKDTYPEIINKIR